MANEVDYSPNKYRGNGSTTEFSFDWKILSVNDIIVQFENYETGEQTTKTFGTDYSVTFSDIGGYVTFNTAPSSDYYVIISRDVSDYQSKRYSTSTGFQGSEIENSFDRVSCNIQEVEYTLKRAIKVPNGSAILDLILPLPDAGKTLKWNEEETGLVNSTIDVDELESIAERLHESIDNIDTVADNILDVNAVADIDEDVSKVADIQSDVVIVSNISDEVVDVSGNKANIDAVVDNETNINTVAGINANVTAVANIKDNIVAVDNNKTNINAVNANKTNIDKVAAIDSDVTKVANIDDNVTAVADNETNINAVNANKTNIDTVAGDKANIDICATNIEAIIDAPNQADTATEQAGIATDKADECIVALAEAESLRDSLRLFSTINAGTLSDTRSIYINAGAISDTRTNYKNGGTLADWHIAGDDIKNILNLPLLYQQADATDEELLRAENRIAQNESDIETINAHLDLNDGEIDELDDRITECESDISDLTEDLSDLETDVGTIEGRVTVNENNISALQDLTDLFNIIDSKTLSDTRTHYFNAGTLSDTRSNYINAGTLQNLSVSKDNLRAISLVPALKAEIDSLKVQLQTALEFIENIKGGINCGTIVKP